MRTSLKRTALSACLALSAVCGTANALIVSEQFDGGYFNAGESGRGLLVDVIPGAGGSVTFFGALFTYDQTGAPLWLTIQPVLAEGQSQASGFEVRRFNGGNFGSPFTPPNPAAGTVIGTGTLDVQSCDAITLSIAPNAGTNLPNVTLDYARLGGASPASCAYKAAFTACPSGTTAVAGVARTCALTGTYTQNLTLPNSATYTINGKVQIGTPLDGSQTQTAILTIEPGTLIKGGSGTSDYLVVNPGSKIRAEGSPTAPIIFTGPTETGGSWSGVVLAGRAPVNNAATPGGTTPFEADANIIFGGNIANDSSGVMRYVQIRNAGQVIASGRELNCLTMGGVGSGTVLEYIQCHNGTDDAFEWFGGTVNAKYLVATGNDDDNLDMDFGYVGRVQFVYAKPDAQVDVLDGRCVESDNTNAQGNQDSLPRTQPKIANLTCSGNPGATTWFEGMRLRRGSGGNYSNAVFANATDACLRFNDTSTYTASGVSPALTGATTMAGGFVSCTTSFKDGSSPPFTVSTWFNTQTGNATGDIAAALTGKFATPGGPLDGTAQPNPSDAFFDQVSYKGAFGPAGVGRDWTAGWTVPGSL